MDMTRSRDIDISRVNSSDIVEIYETIKAEGLEQIISYDVEDFSLKFFKRLVKACEGWFYVCRSKDGVLLAFVLINGFESDRVARIHFCTFRAGRFYLITGGRKVLDWLVPEHFDSLIGWLPEWNKGAIKYLQRLGFYIVGRIPGACGCIHRPACAAIMSVYTTKEQKNANFR